MTIDLNLKKLRTKTIEIYSNTRGISKNHESYTKKCKIQDQWSQKYVKHDTVA